MLLAIVFYILQSVGPACADINDVAARQQRVVIGVAGAAGVGGV
jgi:hypothetical protein